MEKQFLDVKLIIGLGNPGPEYENTYHNAGKLMVNYLLEKRVSDSDPENACFREKTSGNFESCTAGGLTLLKPTNYINENGKAVGAALKSFGTKIDSILVVHDDGDIEIGKYKISFGSGSAGHRGAQSVIENLGTKNFWRLRIGIRPSPRPPAERAGKSAPAPLDAKLSNVVNQRGSALRLKAEEFVLKKITGTDGKLMRSAFEKAIEEISKQVGVR